MMELEDIGWIFGILAAIAIIIATIFLCVNFNHASEPFSDDAGKAACSMKGMSYDISMQNKAGKTAFCHVINPYRFLAVNYGENI